MAFGTTLLDRSARVAPRPRPRPARYRPDALLVVVAISLLAVIVMSGMAYLHRSRPGPGDATPPGEVAATPWVPGAVAWLTRNVRTGEPILASEDVARNLSSMGLTRVTTDPAVPTPWVVVDATLRRDRAAADVLRRAVPIASYGTGEEQVVVESVIAATPAQVDALVAADRDLRTTAESELAVNPNLRATAAQRATLRSGGLDMRAAVVLAILCADAPATLVDLPQDRAEFAAGRTHRILVLSAAPGVIDRALAALPELYRPSRIVGKHAATQTLIWDAGVSRAALDQRTR